MKTRVSVVKCKTYAPEELQPAVARAFDLLGGISSFVKKGEKVLVKPNILSGSLPERGANTHIEIVRAVVKLVKQCEAIPVIGDNPGGSARPKDVYRSSGMSSVADKEGVALAEVRDVKMVGGIPIASYFFECDKIISLPKMKTHNLTILTGAIKNMYGAISGAHKTELHKRFPTLKEFVNVLLDVFGAVRPHLVLMDGVIAMDGDGPATGTLKSAGLLIAGQDSVAVDSVFSHLIGVNPFNILTTKEAHGRGLGEIELENIEILGERIENAFVSEFRLPRSNIVMRLPGPLVKVMAGLVKFRPYINERLCKKCRICAESCPVAAITIGERQSVIDFQKCIRCMCCNEVCPYSAVELRRNILARVLGL